MGPPIRLGGCGMGGVSTCVAGGMDIKVGIGLAEVVVAEEETEGRSKRKDKDNHHFAL